MFSNRLIRGLARTSDESNLRLSKEDWRQVLDANTAFSEPEESERGNGRYAQWLLSKVGAEALSDANRALELCCGNGFLYFSFREIEARFEDFVYVDISSAQLKAFKRRAAGSTRMPAMAVADVMHLPFKNGSFDLVFGNSFLHHIPDVELCLREVHRVLVPNGRFVAFHEPTPTAPRLEFFPLHYYRRFRRRADPGSLTDIWLIEPRTLKRLLHQSGFPSVTVSYHGLASAFVAEPLRLLTPRFRGGTGLVDRVRRRVDELDRVLPQSVLRRFAPSIAVVARRGAS